MFTKLSNYIKSDLIEAERDTLDDKDTLQQLIAQNNGHSLVKIN